MDRAWRAVQARRQQQEQAPAHEQLDDKIAAFEIKRALLDDEIAAFESERAAIKRAEADLVARETLALDGFARIKAGCLTGRTNALLR